MSQRFGEAILIGLAVLGVVCVVVAGCLRAGVVLLVACDRCWCAVRRLLRRG